MMYVYMLFGFFVYLAAAGLTLAIVAKWSRRRAIRARIEDTLLDHARRQSSRVRL